MEENWKDVVGYEGLYMVSDIGNVKSLPRPKQITKKSYKAFLKGKQLKISFAGTGKYPFVSLWKDGKFTQYYIHRLVLTAFIGQPAPYMTCNHKNGIHTDNRVDNLEWITQHENNLHKFRVLGYKNPSLRGEDSARATLTWKQVRLIRKLREKDPERWMLKTLASKFHSTISNIHNIVMCRTWIEY